MLAFNQYGVINKQRSTLVFIHGFCQNNTCFQEQVLFFKDSHAIVLVDLPGFGNSKAIQAHSIVEMADCVIGLLDQLGIENFIPLGHSMGAYVALALANKVPLRLKGLGLIHSTAKADSPERIAKRIQTKEFIVTNGMEPYVKAFIPGLFLEQNNNTEWVNEAIVRGLNASQTGIVEAVLAMIQRPDLTPMLSELSVPVFWAIGKYDTLLPELDLFAQAATCKFAHIAYLKNSAHMGLIEEPEAFNTALLNYLDLLE